jgi:thiosulfate/3-mercaptopyruvate sulfurtransferase
VVDVEWWLAHADETVTADVRWYLDGRDGRAVYESGHLPGAVFVDLDRDLAGPHDPAEGRHPLPTPEQFAAAMARVGIGDRTAVVAYDDGGGVIAARLVWMLRVTGHDAALLDGGITAYAGPLSTQAPAPARADFTPVPWPAEALARIDEVAHLGEGTVLLDARQPERYRGEVESTDPRAGHIPGARNLSCRDNLGLDGRFLPVEELRRRFAEVGIDERTRWVSSCGSGVTACHTLLAAEHVGLPGGRLYPGSWSQWSSDPERPAATGATP